MLDHLLIGLIMHKVLELSNPACFYFNVYDYIKLKTSGTKGNKTLISIFL